MKPDDYLDDDADERDRFSAGAIFASGWFRAVLVLGVLAITLVVTVPYVLRWMDPGHAGLDGHAARTAEPAPSVATAPTPLAAPSPVAPAATAPSASAPAPTPPAPGAPATDHVVAARPAVAPSAAAPSAEREAASPRAVEPKKAETAVAAKGGAHPASRGGEFWVQVGAFQRERNAVSLVRSIRDDLKMPVHMSRSARAETVPAAGRHEVFVSGAPVGAVNAVLRGHGSAQVVRGGVAVQPPLELKDAVALSRRLSGEGLSVKIRRVGGERAAEDPGVSHVVRVGGYATRAQAEAARRELARKGVTGFVTSAVAK